ncbi:ACT domain-containing protein [Clostridium formicaceticum]|nr:ACT domain-containing protein [Clostridium formicaceticum]
MKTFVYHMQTKGRDSDMESDGNTYYIVKAEVLPEVFIKTMEVKDLLKKGKVTTIFEAVERVGMSRSAYYKYKDAIFPLYEMNTTRMITMAMILEHSPGVLSEVLNEIANAKASILTINQNIPVHGVANVTISLELKNMMIQVSQLIQNLESMEGVNKVTILAKE